MMQQPVQSLAQRETYTPSGFTRFLWWLSTAEKELLIECSVDRNRYAITGMAVLGTWLFATLAWSYFFSTVVDNVFAAILLGVFMGGIILSIDRALIKGINATNKRKLVPVLFRLVLAITIGTFMAQPALLYLFDKEIHVQISLDNERRKMDKKHELDSLYAKQVIDLNSRKAALQSQLETKYAEVSGLRDAYIAETDGTGGSGKIGLEKIARAKQNEYTRADSGYAALNSSIQPQIALADSALNAIDATKLKEEQAFNALLNDGFLTRIEALHNLIKNNSAAQFRYYLLIIILVLIELMPVIAKMLLPDGTYDEKVRLRELMEKAVTKNNHDHEQALKELYNKLAYEQDAIFVNDFFEQSRRERQQKMLAKLQAWKNEEIKSFDNVWEDLKKDFLAKQEN